jgi:hypothetical protein
LVCCTTAGNLPTGREEYYLGHGTGAISWCPIMGAGYYTTVGQWSKGEYKLANNHEDDLAIIASRRMASAISLTKLAIAPQGAIPLTFSGPNVNQKGYITQQNRLRLLRIQHYWRHGYPDGYWSIAQPRHRKPRHLLELSGLDRCGSGHVKPALH